MGKMEINPEEFMSAEMNAIMDYLQPLKTLLALDRPMSIEMMKSGALASITALQPVFAGGQIVLGNKLARLGEEISQLQLQLSEKEVEAQVERYYWQLVSMNEKTQTLDAVDSMLLQIRHDVETAVKAGVALRNDLLQVQLRQNDIKSQRLKLNNGRELMWLMLKQFCGLSETRTMDDLGLMNEELRLMNEDLGLMNEDSSQLSSISQPQCSSSSRDKRGTLLMRCR
jgi:outer membrane protein TolC